MPLLKFIKKDLYNVYRKIDKKLGKKMNDKIGLEKIFEIQYKNLKNLLKDIK